MRLPGQPHIETKDPVERLRNLKKTDFFTLKPHQKFSFHITPEELKTQQSPVILGLYLWKTRSGKLHNFCTERHGFEKLNFKNVIPPHEDMKAGVIKFLRFEERFLKAPFS